VLHRVIQQAITPLCNFSAGVISMVYDVHVAAMSAKGSTAVQSMQASTLLHMIRKDGSHVGPARRVLCVHHCAMTDTLCRVVAVLSVQPM
jgi:hypothetical protein